MESDKEFGDDLFDEPVKKAKKVEFESDSGDELFKGEFYEIIEAI